VDEDYILDRFNLTGLNAEVVQEYARALDLITDSLGAKISSCSTDCTDDDDLDDDVREAIETSARFLYGLIHARYIITSRGLSKMVSVMLGWNGRLPKTCT
jgi:casein kinase II subunit beta